MCNYSNRHTISGTFHLPPQPSPSFPSTPTITSSPLRWFGCPLAVLGCSLFLHGVLQYGLKEAFLYSLHHLPAQICIAALPLAPQTSKWERRIVSGILTAYLICLVVLDLPGYQALWQYICK